MRDIDDRELLALCRDDHPEAFNELVRRYQERIYRVLLRLVGDRDDALDLAQDVFFRAWKGIRDFRGDAQVFTWLYRIAMNLGLNHIRKRKLRSALPLHTLQNEEPAHPENPQHEIERDEIRELIERAVEKLPAKQRAVFILRYYDDMPYEQIASILNTSVGGLKANYFHAVQKLRNSLHHAL
ncbi:MAG: sigma-70 family RNA polymerase sigma factor [Bacteroidota bacterium]|nr:sigma-70 family RNA polymerase sigma factor [Bacteroidota bacterium]